MTTKVEKLRAAIDVRLDDRSSDVAHSMAGDAIVDAALPLVDLWEACEAERDAVCTNQPTRSVVAGGYHVTTIGDVENRCIGTMHTATCAVALARAAVAAVLAKGLP